MTVGTRFIPSAWSALAVATGVVLAFSSSALAANLGPGQSATVDASTPLQTWSLANGAQLTIRPGGQTQQIRATAGSNLAASGATITASAIGLELVDSTAAISESTIKSTGSFGLSLVTNPAGGLAGSTAIVNRSSIEGLARGINATGSSRLVLRDSQVHGVGNGAGTLLQGGVGALLLGASVSLERSAVTGDHTGVAMVRDTSVGYGSIASLTLDNSTVQAGTGTAITVGGTNLGAAGSGVTADIVIANGSNLMGGNGRILEVEASNVVTMTVDNSRLTGDIMAADVSDVTLAFDNAAWLTGSINGADALNIDASAGWTLTGDSQLGELVLKGMADLRGTDGNAAFNRLQVDNLSGSGTFALGTDLAAGLGDFLDVTGTATGSHTLLIDNTGAEPVEGADDLQVVHTGGGDAAFSVVGDTVDAGAYTYQLEQRPAASGANDWFLVQIKQPSRSASAAVGLFSAAPTVWYGETTTLRTRMGELRNGNGNGNGQGGAWLRSYGNKHNVSGGSEFTYSQNQRGMSFGADAPLTAGNGQWLMGVMGGYSQSNLDLGAGSSGKVDSFYIGAYSTWLADNGYYVDALIKANRLQNRTDVVMRDGQKAKGRYTQHGIGGSVEVGKHIALDESTFVAPYAQVSALWITAGDYALDNGLDARGDTADSLVGKVGALVGRRFALEHGGSVQPYVKVAVAHEFANGNKVKVNGHRFDNDLSGTRGELGVGVSAQMTDVLQVHADFDYMQGKHIEQPWGVSVGVRYNF